MFNKIKYIFINFKLTLQEIKYYKLENKLLNHRDKMINSYNKYKDVDARYSIVLQMERFKKLMLRWQKELELSIKLMKEGINNEDNKGN